MRHVCRSIHNRWGKLDLWAHTAVHVPPLSPAGHVAVKDWDETLTTHPARHRHADPDDRTPAARQRPRSRAVFR